MLQSSGDGIVGVDLAGMVAAIETLFVNSVISNLIREGKICQIPSVIQTGKKQGMAALNDALFKLVVEKTVDPNEAYIKAVDKQAFAALLKSKGIELSLTVMDE